MKERSDRKLNPIRLANNRYANAFGVNVLGSDVFKVATGTSVAAAVVCPDFNGKVVLAFASACSFVWAVLSEVDDYKYLNEHIDDLAFFAQRDNKGTRLTGGEIAQICQDALNGRFQRVWLDSKKK